MPPTRTSDMPSSRPSTQGFTWLDLGNAGISMSVPLRLAPVVGVYGLSFVFAALAAGVAGLLLLASCRDWLAMPSTTPCRKHSGVPNRHTRSFSLSHACDGRKASLFRPVNCLTRHATHPPSTLATRSPVSLIAPRKEGERRTLERHASHLSI